MNNQIKLKAQELQRLLKEQSDFETVSATFFFSSEGYEISYRNRTADDLRENGISMKNLCGDFIK